MANFLHDQRLRKQERLLRKADFDAVFEHGSSAGDKRLVIHCRENGLPYPRLGLVVGRRFGNAVERNRFKRRLREIFRRHKVEANGLDLVVLPSKRPEAGTADMAQLRESFLRLLARLRGGRRSGAAQ